MNPGLTFQEKELQKLISQFTLAQQQKNPFQIKKKKVIVISGPTAVGKTKRSLLLAHLLKGEVISADSMQVYRGMDIGTAKVSKEDRLKIPHHLIDTKELSERFNVADFYQDATQAMQNILARQKVPIVVGGTGFYIHALIYGPPKGPPGHPEIRTKLEDEMKQFGMKALYDRLSKLDPEYAKTITENDRHKVIRALEIISLTNQKVSDFPKPTVHQDEYDFRCWFLYQPKEVLYPMIEMRCDEMIAKGFIDEVKALEKIGLRHNMSASQAIGYRQCLEYLDSKQTQEDFDAFVAGFKQASRRYAKRQFTWFRKEPLFRWLNVDQMSLESSVSMILQDYESSL